MTRFAANWRLIPILALAGAVLLLLTGLAIGSYNERIHAAQDLREAQVQARILAASVAAALAFDDRGAAREYVGALRANPQIETAGVYDKAGRLLAGYSRASVRPPAAAPTAPMATMDGRLTVVAPVVQAGTLLGSVSLQRAVEPAANQLARAAGTGLLLGMALLVVAVLAAAQALMTRANRELAQRAAELADSNRELHVQIAEREKAEEALRQSQKMEAVGQLTGGIAHDFNNILMVASSGLDLLERTTDPTRRDTIRAGIRQAVERGASLTRQLLTFSRRSALKPEVVDLKARLEGMRMLLERSLREDVAVTFDLPADLWRVELDPGQLELAILNIAVNARDAMPSGGTIAIAAENAPGLDESELSGDFVRLSITDTGEGIPPEKLAHVFEPFFTTKEVGKGTGLGLSQVYGFVHASGGDVRIESRPGAGATVRLLLPRTEKAASLPPPPRRETRRRGQRQARVLMVEDDPTVAEMVGGMLGELGYEVRHAPTAADALAGVEADPPVSLVFSDMVMPGGMDGIELAREIARRRPGLPVLLTTGFSPAAAAAERDGLRLLPKPYSIESLAAALDAALSRH